MNSLPSLTTNSFATRAPTDARVTDTVPVTRISAIEEAKPDSGATALPLPKSDQGSVKDRIDGLIDRQLSNGTLNEEQAAGLQSFFAEGRRGVLAPADNDAAANDASKDSVPIGSTAAALGARSAPVRTAMDDELRQLTMLVDKMRQSLSAGVTYGSGGGGSVSGRGGGAARSGLLIDGTA